MTIQHVEENMADAVSEWGSGVDRNDTASATNDDVVITIPAPGLGMHNIVDTVAWSYDVIKPTNGYLSIEDDTVPPTEVFRIEISIGGQGWRYVKKRGSTNTPMTITLGDGGQGVVGRLNIVARRRE